MDRKEILNIFTWLVNRVSEPYNYKSWSDRFAREDINRAISEANVYLAEKIKWEELTSDDCDFLGFGRWKDERDLEEDIESLTNSLKKGHITIQEFEEKKKLEEDTLGLRLIPLYLFPIIPNGLEVICINGKHIVKHGNNLDNDARCGCIAYGIKPFNKL